MSTIVLLDSGPLGLATNPRPNDEAARCAFWVRSLPTKGMLSAVPEIADYEVRRELLRAGKSSGARKLDRLKQVVLFVPLRSETMLLAAELWAEARRRGRPTADDRALDADVILVAQARTLAQSGHTVIVASTNLRHRSHLVDARLWTDIG